VFVLSQTPYFDGLPETAVLPGKAAVNLFAALAVRLAAPHVGSVDRSDTHRPNLRR
jgi:hypothetical protein